MSLAWRWLAAGLGVSGLALAGVTCGWRSPGADVPVAVVEKGTFERRVVADGVVRAAESEVIAVPASVQRGLRIGWIAPEGSRVRAGDVVLRFDPTELERELADGESNLESNHLKVKKERTESETTLANLERDAETARRELEFARVYASRDDQLFSRVEIAESQIDEDLARARLGAAEASFQREGRLTRTDLEILAIERRRTQADVDRAREGLDALTVKAPADGILMYQRDWRGEAPKVGESAFPGQPLAEIPNLGRMEVDAFVLEADAGGLEAGKVARVYLESRPDQPFTARVARVDNLAKPRHRGSPVQYFAVVLAFEGDTVGMNPGQRARVELTLEQRAEVLMVPRQALFEQDGKTHVLRREGRGFTPVPVTRVSSGSGRAVIEGALEAGQEVALVDPNTHRNGTTAAPPTSPPAKSGGGR